MASTIRLSISAAYVILPALLCASAEAQFTRDTTNIPTGNIGFSENVDFGDVDGDGDWDAVIADGGDFGNQQNRIWINQGGQQGGVLGKFLDATAAQFPAVLDDSRDIEFADIDDDGDLDLYISNTAQLSNQSNRWWINMGGVQGGTQGFYQEQTLSRWVNLGVNNPSTKSSIPANLVIVAGGFVDWSCDCDFGDIDNDGDLDLVHSTYGGTFGGQVPTRLFLNTAGFFEEFNPSGYQLPNTTIVPNEPGIWVSGTQQTNTTNSTGANCDVASSALDIDLGDIDGDLDLDILHGARQEVPRMFQNRLQENGGVLTAFRDVTGSAFPAGYSTGDGHYEQEMGDLDKDGDLDIYGLNWLQGGFTFTDMTLNNTGNGVYNSITSLTNSNPDDNEGDFLDYDMDGDLDLFVANFSGQERLYRNNYAGGGPGTFSFTYANSGNMPSDSTISLDADACDVDEDGDTDVFVSNDDDQAEWFLKNGTSANDTFAPVLLALEQAPDRAAGAAPTVVRVQVYDNAPYYITWYNNTDLEYSVNGGAFTAVDMLSSAGQIFRGEIPGALVGTIDYRVRSSDKYGNTGVSTTKTFNASTGCSGTPTAFCTAKTTGNGCVPAIGSSGTPSASAGSGFFVNATNMINNKSCLLFYGVTGQGNAPFQGGTLCVKAPIRRTPGTTTGGNPPPNDCSGVPSIDMNLFAVGGLGGSPLPSLTVIGTVVNCQWWGRDPGFAAPNNTQLSDGLEYTICP